MSAVSSLSLLRTLTLATVLSGVAVALSAAPAAYQPIVYPAPDVSFTSVTGINARGDVVGQVHGAQRPPWLPHGQAGHVHVD